jgi:TP901 family phage tail tape measure protein
MPGTGEMNAKLIISVEDQLARARLQGFAGTAKGAFGDMEKDFSARVARMRTTAESLSALGSTLTMAGGAGIAAMVPLVKTSMDLDQALRNVNSIAKGGEQGFKDMGKAIRDIASDPLVTDMPVELANGLYQIYSSGLQGKVALDALRISAKGAMAGMSDTATASTVLVAAMNAYGGKTAQDAQRYMDVFFKTVEQGVLTFPQLAGGMGNVIGMAAQLKVPIETVGAAVSTMTRMGVGAEESFTSLQRIFGELLTPSKLMKDALTATGYESGLALLQARGLAGAMEWLTQVTHGNSAEMATMLGEVRAVRGAMAMTGEGAVILADQETQMAQATGAYTAAAIEQMKGAENEWKKAMQSISVSGLETGSALWNAFAPVLTLIQSVVTGINSVAGVKIGDFPLGKYAVGAGGLAAVGTLAAGGAATLGGMVTRGAAGVAELAGPASKLGQFATKAPRILAKAGAVGAGVGAVLAGVGLYENAKARNAQKRAKGGHIGGSDIAWVGEEGPELAVARGGGVEIIPMKDIPGFQGGGHIGSGQSLRVPERGWDMARPVGWGAEGWGGGGPGMGRSPVGHIPNRGAGLGSIPEGYEMPPFGAGRAGLPPRGQIPMAERMAFGRRMFGGGFDMIPYGDAMYLPPELRAQIRQKFGPQIGDRRAPVGSWPGEHTTPEMSFGPSRSAPVTPPRTAAPGGWGSATWGGAYSSPYDSAFARWSLEAGADSGKLGSERYRGWAGDQSAMQGQGLGAQQYMPSGWNAPTQLEAMEAGRANPYRPGGMQGARAGGFGLNATGAGLAEGWGQEFGGGENPAIASYLAAQDARANAPTGAFRDISDWKQFSETAPNGRSPRSSRVGYGSMKYAGIEPQWRDWQKRVPQPKISGSPVAFADAIGGALTDPRKVELETLARSVGASEATLEGIQAAIAGRAGGGAAPVGGLDIEGITDQAMARAGRTPQGAYIGAGGGLDMVTQGEGVPLAARGGARSGGERSIVVNITVQGSIYGDRRLHDMIGQDVRKAVQDAVLAGGPTQY